MEGKEVTFSDLTVDAGLLDVTCSGLLTSPDGSPKKGSHNFSICSCAGDTHEDSPDAAINTKQEVEHSIEASRAADDDPPSQEEHRQHNVVITEVDEGENKVLSTNNAEENVIGPIITTENKKNRMPLLNETSFDYSKFLDDFTYSSSLRLGFTNTTHYYNLSAGSIQVFSDDEDDAISEIENLEVSGPPSVGSQGDACNGPLSDVVDINAAVGNVSFCKKSNLLKERNQINEFLSKTGDIEAGKFHEVVETYRDKLCNGDAVLTEMAKTLQSTLEENENLQFQVQALMSQLEESQQQLQKLNGSDQALIQGASAETPEPDTISSQSEANSEVEDLRLQVQNLEKKLEADRKYLEIQTAERELERDDYQKTISNLTSKLEDAKRDKFHLENVISNQKAELEDYDMRLKEETDAQTEAMIRKEKAEEELRAAVDKVMELRDIIRDLESRLDATSVLATELRDEKLILQEEVNRLEEEKAKRADITDISEDCCHQCTDLVDELPTQVQELYNKIERKVSDMEMCQSLTRPNSSCSNGVSNEDVSVAHDVCCMTVGETRDVAAQVAGGIQKLGNMFETLIRYEEIMLKKLRDTELLLSNSKKEREELEAHKEALQDKIKSLTTVISDLESALDKYRFESVPSSGTLSGLRARVSTLTGDKEELEGKLQLRELEMKDLKDKLAEKEALLRRSLHRIPDVPENFVQKFNTAVQTDMHPDVRIVTITASCQTEKQNQKDFVIPKTPATKVISSGVQTVLSAVKGGEALELSYIHGTVPVTHSTPNEGSTNKASARTDRGGGVSWNGEPSERTWKQDVDRTPEMLREPADSRFNNSFMSDRFPLYTNKQGPATLPPARIQEVPIAGRLDADINGGSDAAHKDTQTPPLGIANLVNALDEDEKRQLIQALSQTGLRSDLDSQQSTATQGGITSLASSSEGQKSEPAKTAPAETSSEQKRTAENRTTEENIGTNSGNNAASDRNGRAARASSTHTNPLHSNSYHLDDEEPDSKTSVNSRSPGKLALPIEGIEVGRTGNAQLGNGSSAAEDGARSPEHSRQVHSAANTDMPQNVDSISQNLPGTRDYYNQNRNVAGTPLYLKLFKEYHRKYETDRSVSGLVEHTLEEGSSWNGGSSKWSSRRTRDKIDDSERQGFEISVSQEFARDTANPSNFVNSDTSQESAMPDGQQEGVAKNSSFDSWDSQDSITIENVEELACIDVEFTNGEPCGGDEETCMNSLDIEEIRRALNECEGDCAIEFEATCEFQVASPCDTESQVDNHAARQETSRDGATQVVQPNTSGHQSGPQIHSPPPDAQHYDWQSMERTKEGRMNEADCRIELETLKTRMSLIQKAFESEKKSNETMKEQLLALESVQRDHLKLQSLLCHEQGRNSELSAQLEQQCTLIRNLQMKFQEPETREVQMSSKGVGDQRPHVETLDSCVGGTAALVAQNYELMKEMRRLQDASSTDGARLAFNQLQGLQRAELNCNPQMIKGSSQRWFDLYVRAKSYRKALAWQKKYLGLVIQGYKELLAHTAGAFEHPDLLQREIPLTPSSVGLCNTKQGKTRFRILGKVVLASIRMKFMVNRWASKGLPRSAPHISCRPWLRSESSRYGSVSSNSDTESVDSDTQHKRCVKFTTSPPTKDTAHRSSRSAPQRTFKPLEFKTCSTEPQSSKAHAPIQGSAFKKPEPRRPSLQNPCQDNQKNIPGESLSEYFERFQSLQNDIGTTLLRETRVVMTKPPASKQPKP